MFEQNFGHKELSELVLRAKDPMQFGDRYIESGEPVLYFDDITISALNEPNRPVFARGGFGNMPRVVWDNRDDVTFSLTDGVLSNIGMSIVFGANVLYKAKNSTMLIPKREGPLDIQGENYIYLEHWPSLEKKVFIFDYEAESIQKKVYGKLIRDIPDPFDSNKTRPCIQVFEDKNCQTPVKNTRSFVIDYYYEYRDEALTYEIMQERFNGLFTLEGKFYSKDENEGNKYLNILYMPKVRVVSNISLRLGERADPLVSTFNVIGLPETIGDKRNVICEITRLGEIDAEI